MKKEDLLIDDDNNDVEFIARMIIGCKYGKKTKANQIKNCLINLLNSNSIDVDSLDYIIRDSKLSGIDNMSVDVDRLLNSLTIIERTNFINKRLKNAEIETNVSNDSVLSSIDASTKCKIEGRFKGDATASNFSGKLNGLISVNGHFKANNKVTIQNPSSQIIKVNGSTQNNIPDLKHPADLEFYIITDNCLEVSGTVINTEKDFNGKIKFESEEVKFKSVFINGKLTGLFSGSLLGCYTSIGGTLECELGFNKSSLSVIQNVLVARNYEYQWIYSHHKVVYYANYLLIELLRKCIKYILIKAGKTTKDLEDTVITSILSWSNIIKDDKGKLNPYDFDGVSFLRVVDSDIIALFKKCQIMCLKENDTSSECHKLLYEYLNRKYKKSLWKSYPEFKIFFGSLSDYEKDKLYDLVIAKAKHRVQDKYGYFCDEWENKFNSFNIQQVIWVNSHSKLKVLEPDKTFILFDNVVLNFGTVASEYNLNFSQNLRSFYLYYEKIYENQNIDTEGIKDFIKEELKVFLAS